jgi:SsrA-binding protein
MTPSPILTTNKKASYEYHILEKFQAGLALANGDLVKKIRTREITPEHSFVVFQNNRLEVIGLGNMQQKTSIPLLLNKAEVKKIRWYIKDKGITCILLNFKMVNRYLKADIAVVKGKSTGDKRQTIKARDIERDRQRGID